LIRYLGKRIALGAVSLVVLLFALFVIIEIAVPGDVVTPLRLGLTAQEVDEIREQIGITRPFPVRFWDWLQAFVGGQVQITSFGPQAGRNVFAALPSTLLVFVVGLAFAYVVGTWLGRFTAWRRGIGSGTVTLLGVVTYTIFPPFLAFGLSWLLDTRLRRLSARVFESQGNLWRDAPFTENDVIIRMLWVAAFAWLVVALLRRVLERYTRWRVPTVLVVIVGFAAALGGWAWRGLWWWSLDLLFAAAVPILGFAILSFGEFLLVTQTAMGATMADDYVLTAQAKGLSPRRVRDHHAGRNAKLVVATRVAVSLPYLLTGLVIIETALAYPGVGSFMFGAIETQDLPAVMTGLAVVGMLALGIRLFLDMASAWADPRIRDGLAEEVAS
jgi:peptide/nickel transport system permease protein